MKKRLLSNLKVKRISTSPYFKESFARLEKDTIEKKAGPDIEVLPLNSPTPADILITNTHTVTAAISKADLEQCALMIHPNSGYDNLEASFVASADFPIVIGNPIRAQAVTNTILSTLFAHYSAVPAQTKWDEGRKWNRQLLSELSVVILGHGHIGGLLEKSLRPLVKTLQVYDPYQNLTELELAGVDVVLPACSLNRDNHYMINRAFLNQLSENFTLINAARGQLVKTTDLIEVLKERPKAFAYLDVFEEEPADFSRFKGLTNIALSSHIAGVYSAIDQVTADYVASVIVDFRRMNENEFSQKYKNVLLQSRVRQGQLI